MSVKMKYTPPTGHSLVLPNVYGAGWVSEWRAGVGGTVVCSVSYLKKEQGRSDMTPPLLGRGVYAGLVTKPPVLHWPFPREQMSMGVGGGPRSLESGAFTSEVCAPDGPQI